MAGWVTGIVLALLIGVNIGQVTGRHMAIEQIAGDCRYGKSFVLRRTAFDCEVRKK